MKGTELIKAMVSGTLVSEIGACGWLHTPEVDRSTPKAFAQKIIEMTDQCRWDFIKVMPNGVYNQEAYGSDITYLSHDIPLEKLKTKAIMHFNRYLLNCSQDFYRFPQIDVSNNSVYQREVAMVRELSNHYKGVVPILPTIFMPAHCVPEFCGGIEKAKYFFDHHEAAVEAMLEALTQTALQLVDAYIDAGADGFFFASRYGSSDLVNKNFFQRFCRPFEEEILKRVKDRTWFNIMHVHGDKNLFLDEFNSYPVQAISWENTPLQVPEDQQASVEMVRKITNKVLITGTDQFNDFYGTPKEIKERLDQRVARSAKESGDNRLVFAPGCSLPLDITTDTLYLLRQAVDDYNKQG